MKISSKTNLSPEAIDAKVVPLYRIFLFGGGSLFDVTSNAAGTALSIPRSGSATFEERLTDIFCEMDTEHEWIPCGAAYSIRYSGLISDIDGLTT